MENTAPKQLTPILVLRNSLERPEMMDEFKKALPKGVDVQKFVRIVVTAVASAKDSDALLAADRPSLYMACMRAAQDGLMPDGQEAALVVYSGKVAYMPMAKGILKKARNSGELSSINAHLIHKNDPFKYWVDSVGEHIEHNPDLFGDRGDMIGVYALAKTKDGGIYVEVMTKEQVMATKSAGRAGDKGPWKGPFESEMWKKAVLRRICKRLPSSSDLDQVFKADDENYDFDKPEEEKAPPAVTSTRLAAAVSAGSGPVAEAPAQAPAAPVSETDQPL